MKTISISTLIKWSLVFGSITTLVTYSIYFYNKLNSENKPTMFIKCPPNCKKDYIFYIENLEYKDKLLLYYQQLDSTSTPFIYFPLNIIGENSKIHVLDYSKDSILVKFYCGEFNGDPIVGYVLRKHISKKIATKKQHGS